MPTPPTYTLDYCKVGGESATDWRQTWGRLRFPLGFDNTVVDYGSNDIEYDKGFLAADGSLFRQDYGFYGNFVDPPSRLFYFDSPMSTPPYGDFAFGTFTLPPVGPGPYMDEDDYAQLTGETVTMSGGSFTIGVDSYTNPPMTQTVASGLGTFVSVGKLTTF